VLQTWESKKKCKQNAKPCRKTTSESSKLGKKGRKKKTRVRGQKHKKAIARGVEKRGEKVQNLYPKKRQRTRGTVQHPPHIGRDAAAERGERCKKTMPRCKKPGTEKKHRAKIRLTQEDV